MPSAESLAAIRETPEPPDPKSQTLKQPLLGSMPERRRFMSFNGFEAYKNRN